MGLIINQGKHHDQPEFVPIDEKDVQMVIEKVELHPQLPSTLKVTFRILAGANKNRVVFDNISYDPASPVAWKYLNLRKSAGVPYSEEEPAQLDIGVLLTSQLVVADLATRNYTAKDGTAKKAQGITYKEKPANTTINLGDSDMVEFPDETVADGDLPFDSAVENGDDSAVKQKSPVEPDELPEEITDDDWD